MHLSKEAKNAIYLGSVCSFAYFVVYIIRNVFSTVNPQMISEGLFGIELVGTISSIFFVAYAVGQLINGIIGDIIKAKYMICGGLVLSGVANLLFGLNPSNMIIAYVTNALCAFFLSMIYAPMVKVIADSTSSSHAVRCVTGLSLASFIASPVTGVLAATFNWKTVFVLSSAMIILSGVGSYIVFTVFEKNGIAKYNVIEKQQKEKGNIKLLFKHQIVRYTFVSILTGVIRTAVVFWLPTYLSEYLGFNQQSASLIFSGATLIISLSAFLALFVYERLNRNMNLSTLIFFIISAVSFLGVYFVKQPILNIILMIMAILMSNSAASILWSIYCPSLTETKMVSSATGFLDFVSYMAAAISSKVFADSVSQIGWGNLILVWFVLMAIGVIVTISFKKTKAVS